MTDYPESQAVKVWTYGNDIICSIVLQKMGHYCGYCRFPKRPLVERGYDGIDSYIPVHGGITYTEEHEDGSMVYGFDCAHAGDEEKPEVRDLTWLSSECERMAQAINLAAEYEEQFLLAKDNETIAQVLDKYHAKLKEQDIEFNLVNNFGAMIRVLCGKLK